MSDNAPDPNVIEMAAEIVSAYVRNNSVPAGELPALLQSVFESLGSILNGAKPEPVKEPPQPKVPIKRSVTNDYIICLEDGKRFKSLKRHLHSEHGLSPQEYRDKWSLGKDYPMVAPAYADARSNLAKTMGLGRKVSTPATDAAEPELDLPELAAETATPDHEDVAAEAPKAAPERAPATVPEAPAEPELPIEEPAKAEAPVRAEEPAKADKPADVEEPAKAEPPAKKPRRGRAKATA